MKILNLALLLGLVSSTAAFATEYDLEVSLKDGSAGTVVYRMSNSPVDAPSTTVQFSKSARFLLMDDNSSVGRLDVYDARGNHLLYCNDGQLSGMAGQAYLGKISNPIKLIVSGDANYSKANLENGVQICDGNRPRN